MTAVTLSPADRKRCERKDALRLERDQALGEIGREEARGKQQLADRAQRARAAVWSAFKNEMEKLKP